MNARHAIRLQAYLITVFTMCACIADARADQVHLSDGSTIVGKIAGLAEGKLTIETQYAGTLTIDAAGVTGFSADQVMSVLLESGDRVVGTPSYDAERGQRITSEAIGEVTVAEVSKVTAMWGGDGSAPAVAERDARIAELEKRVEAFRDPWNYRLQFGVTGSTGNNERLAFNGRADAKREVELERLYLFAEGFYAEENNQRNKNEVLGGIRLERDISERTFLWGKAGLEFDEFENLDLRSTLSAGIGYFVIKEPTHEWKIRGGAGYQHEAFDDGSSDDNAVLDLGWDYRIDLHEYLRFTNSLTYYPALEEPLNDYRFMVETAAEVPIAGDQGWKLRAGMRNDYDAMPQPGVERLDTTYFLNLVYDFK